MSCKADSKIKVMISGRHPAGQPLETFYHEFETTHVNLMRKARCERFLNRYTQNKTLRGVENPELLFLNDRQIDSQASLVFDDFETMNRFFCDPDYNQIVQTHDFIDPDHLTFDLTLEDKLKSGTVPDSSVKVLYYIKAATGIARDEFHTLINTEFNGHLSRNSLLHVRGYGLPVDPAQFKNTSFEKAKIGYYDVIDELWFENMKHLQEFHAEINPQLQKLVGSIDFKQSFSLLTTDRVVFGNRP